MSIDQGRIGCCDFVTGLEEGRTINVSIDQGRIGCCDDPVVIFFISDYRCPSIRAASAAATSFHRRAINTAP